MRKIKYLIFPVGLSLVFATALGAAWTTKRLTNNVGLSRDPAIAVDGSYVYAVWSDDTTGNKEIYFRKSVDGGVTWQSAKRITNNTGVSHGPTIAVNGTDICVAWYDSTPGNNEIYFMKSTDRGSNWMSPHRITDNANDSLLPAIAISAANVYIVWQDLTPGNWEIFFKRSIDGGSTWQSAKRLTNTSADSLWPAITVFGSKIYLAWYSNTTGNDEIYLQKSLDGGTTWQSAKRLTNNAGDSFAPTVAVNGANIYMAWSDSTPGNSQIYFRKSTNGGASWQSAKRLSNTTGKSINPAIAVKDEKVYIVWSDSTSGDLEIYFIRSADGGATWKTAQRFTNNSGNSQSPSIAVSATKIYVLWDNYTSGNEEIYLKYSPVL